jgi:hypothetical protein
MLQKSRPLKGTGKAVELALMVCLSINTELGFEVNGQAEGCPYIHHALTPKTPSPFPKIRRRYTLPKTNH